MKRFALYGLVATLVVLIIAIAGWYVVGRQGWFPLGKSSASTKQTQATTREDVANDFVTLALEKARAGEVEEALKALDVAIAADPQGAAEAYYYRGLIRGEQGNANAAIEDLTKAIEINPHMPQAWAARGSFYLLQMRPAKAIEDFNKAIELDPQHAPNYVNRGQAYMNLEMIDLALQDFNKAIELDPNSVAAYFNRGVLYFQQKKIDEAIADFTKCIELDPNAPAPYFNRAVAYIEKDEREKAAVDLAVYLKIAKDEMGRHQAEALLENLREPTLSKPSP